MSDVLLAGLTLLSLVALATTFMVFPASGTGIGVR